MFNMLLSILIKDFVDVFVFNVGIVYVLIVVVVLLMLEYFGGGVINISFIMGWLVVWGFVVYGIVKVVLVYYIWLVVLDLCLCVWVNVIVLGFILILVLEVVVVNDELCVLME